MSAGTPSAVALAPHELESVAAQLETISEKLLAGYARLAHHAERVETELVRTNEELARRLQEIDALRAGLDSILRALPCGVVASADDGSIEWVNPAACELLGANREQVAQGTGQDLIACATADGATREHATPGGQRRVLALRRSPIAGGERPRWVVTIDDRTEEHRLASALASRSRMAALGTMAGGVAHEVRNPLNGVRGFAALLRRELAPGTRARHFADCICSGVDEIDAIVASLLGFAAHEGLAAVEIDTAALVDEAIESACSERGIRARREDWDVSARVDCSRFRGDRIKLRQALRNLIVNALQAQPAGGRVCVEVGRVGSEVQLRVHDAGPGLRPELLDRIGEPFFTTRAEGTGLGLALVHAIARLHGGRLEFRAEPGPLGGADVGILIPGELPPGGERR